MARSWHISPIENSTADNATPMDTQSYALPGRVTFTCGAVPVRVKWRAAGQEIPKCFEVMAGGVLITQTTPLVLEWRDSDNVSQDPSMLYFAAATTGAEVWAIS